MPRETENQFRYGGISDYTDGLANVQHLEFFHLPSGKSVLFKAFITKFSDGYQSEWNEEDAYGRMDPIPTFKRTRRTIAIAWDVPAASFEEAQENLRKSSLLMSMLYPSYKSIGVGTNVNLINSAPVFKMKFMNLAANHISAGSLAADSGLLGYVDGFNYEPDFEVGVFDVASPLALFPKLVKFSCNFKVLHQNALGWDEDGNHRTDFNKFPYSTDVNTEIPTPAPTVIQTRRNISENDAITDSSMPEERTSKSIENVILKNKGTLI